MELLQSSSTAHTPEYTISAPAMAVTVSPAILIVVVSSLMLGGVLSQAMEALTNSDSSGKFDSCVQIRSDIFSGYLQNRLRTILLSERLDSCCEELLECRSAWTCEITWGVRTDKCSKRLLKLHSSFTAWHEGDGGANWHILTTIMQFKIFFDMLRNVPHWYNCQVYLSVQFLI